MKWVMKSVSKTSLNLAANLATGFDKRVLLLDLDHQANVTAVLTRGRLEGPTLAQVLLQGTPAREALRATLYDGLDLLPASAELADVNIALADPTGPLGLGREHRLRRALAPLDGAYDYVIVDTGPQRTLLNVNVLNYVHEVLVPIDPGYWSLLGVQRLEELIGQVREYMDHAPLRIGGVLLTKVMHTNVAREVEAQVRAYFGARVFRTTIPHNVKVEEAHSRGLSVLDYAPESPGARAYLALTEEIIAHERTPHQEDGPRQQPPAAADRAGA
jgi:chromosome partitioning protein